MRKKYELLDKDPKTGLHKIKANGLEKKEQIMKNLYLIAAVGLLLTGCGPERKTPEVYSSLLSISREEIPYSVCAAESGLLITSGLDTNRNSLLDEGEVLQASFLCDGADGQNGISPFVAVHDPCGDGPGVDEMILELEDNTFFAWYKGVGLTVLDENTDYVTTDKQKCRFFINQGEIVESP